MGDSTTHGDRLHECSATCPEYKNGPMPGKVINYRHDDGRNCILGPDRKWRHWDHPVPEPGPREAVDYVCLRSHPTGEELRVDLSSDPPSPLRTQRESDRGAFGMPGLGISVSGLNPHPLLTSNGDGVIAEPKRLIKPDGVHVDYGNQGYNVFAETDQARRILRRHLPTVAEHFLKRNAEYGEEAHILGVKGQFADINRKVIKLKRYLWDDVPVPPGAESIETIAGELIGHLLILIDELDREDKNA